MISSFSRFAKTAVPAAALALSATLAFGTPAMANPNGNVVPGADQNSTVVHTGFNHLSITVDAANAAATHITGKVKNNSDQSFTCAGPRGNSNISGDVTTAKLVKQSEDYYRNNTFRELPKVPLNIGGIPLLGNIRIGELDLGSLGPLIQGFGGVLGDPNEQRKKIAEQYSTARVKGHAGLIERFTIAPGATRDFSVYLNNPSSGPRTDFDAAAFIICTDSTNAAYAFTGYEEGTNQPTGSGWSSPGLQSPGLNNPGLQSPGLQSPGLPKPGESTAPEAPETEAPATPGTEPAASE